MILGKDVIMEESHCRIVTASGSVVGVDGMLRFLWEDPDNEEIVAKDFCLMLHLIDGAKDWLLSMPELSAGGFRAFLDKKSGKSFLVFPNGFAVLLAQEADNCWSLSVAVYQNADGTLRFGLASGELYKMVPEPVFEKVRKIEPKRLYAADSVTFGGDLNCVMGGPQADGDYFSQFGGQVSCVAGDASFRRVDNVASWDSDPKEACGCAWDLDPKEAYGSIEGVVYEWRNDDGSPTIDLEEAYDCVGPVGSKGQQFCDGSDSTEKNWNYLHRDEVHSAMPSGLNESSGPSGWSGPSDIFVGSLRRAKAAVVSEDIDGGPGLCWRCKQDVTS